MERYTLSFCTVVIASEASSDVTATPSIILRDGMYKRRSERRYGVVSHNGFPSIVSPFNFEQFLRWWRSSSISIKLWAKERVTSEEENWLKPESDAESIEIHMISNTFSKKCWQINIHLQIEFPPRKRSCVCRVYRSTSMSISVMNLLLHCNRFPSMNAEGWMLRNLESYKRTKIWEQIHR